MFLYTRILSLFSSAPYSPPQVNEDGTPLDLLPHLTNTSLQTHQGEENVRLLDELVGSGLYNNNGEHIGQLSEEHVQSIIAQISTVLAEVFKAGLQNPVHFQVGHSIRYREIIIHMPYTGFTERFRIIRRRFSRHVSVTVIQLDSSSAPS